MEAAPSAAAAKAAPARSTHAAKRRRAAPSVGTGADTSDSSRGARRRTAATETSLAAKLAQREGEGTRTKLHKSSHVKTFLDMKLHAEFDTHDEENARRKLSFLRKRSKVVEVVAAQDLIFALTRTGVCAVFSRVTHQRLCFVNQSPDEVIRSLFYNKLNESLVTVSVFREDNFSSLKCRSTQLEYMRRKNPEGGYPLFESEQLCWPGFVEFDDVNGKVLTYSAQDKAYKIWDLQNYRPLYTIEDADIHEIKISPGIMLVIYHKQPDEQRIPLFIRSIDTGEILKKFSHILKIKKIDFIEQFNQKLLIKQENEDLQILDVRSGEVIRVPEQRFLTPSAFIFLYENHLFLTFRKNTVTVWNLSGEKVTSFEDHELWHPDCNTNNIYITAKQDLIVSFCRDRESSADAPRGGSVNVSSIFTGKCIAKIEPAPAGTEAAAMENPRHAKALEKVSAVFYNEDQNEIYTGNEKGHLHIWSACDVAKDPRPPESFRANTAPMRTTAPRGGGAAVFSGSNFQPPRAEGRGRARGAALSGGRGTGRSRGRGTAGVRGRARGRATTASVQHRALYPQRGHIY